MRNEVLICTNRLDNFFKICNDKALANETLCAIDEKIKEYQRIKPGVDRLAAAFVQVDKEIKIHKNAHKSASEIKCKNNCGNCCRQTVSITTEEADLLKDEPWTDQHDDGISCVFLSKDNSCTVYSKRPIACRLVMSLSDPKYCGTGETQKVFYIHNAEIEAAGYYNAVGSRHTMKKAIMGANRGDKL